MAHKFLLLVLWVFYSCSSSQGFAQFDITEEPINYYESEPENIVTRLQAKIESGEVKLRYDARTGYLRSVLKELGVSISTQGLVFSKTSLQIERISPRSPRAIYFNDEVYVGYVADGTLIEMSAVDPTLGAVFYTLGQRRSSKPSLERGKFECTQCHIGAMTSRVPGHTVRSLYSGADGRPKFEHGSYITDDTSPLNQRWGGWYVTGTHGDQRHLGNLFIRSSETPKTIDLERGANVTSLAGRFDHFRYLSSHSDIAALMVLEHQTQMHNAITNANYQARWIQYESDSINEATGREEGFVSESAAQRYETSAESLLKRLLFVDEVKLTDTLKGTSNFAAEFAARGPQDSQGRSLRDFDLQKRIFQYPCSYLIYGEAFKTIPSQVQDRLYRKLHDVLTGKNQDSQFDHLSAGDRQAILEILLDTKDDLPAYWNQSQNALQTDQSF